MDEIDRRIGFEDVAPGALALVRLAADEQHLEPVAHAVDGEGGVVVVERQLVRPGLGLDLEHVGAAMVDRDRKRHVLPDRHHARGRIAAVLPEREPRLAAAAAGQILDADGELHLLADDAEARRVLDDEAAVGLARLAGQEHVQRRVERQAVRRRHVVHLAVGDHHRAGDALRRHVGERAHERGVELGAGIGQGRVGIGRAGMDDAHVEVFQPRELLRQVGERRVGERAPVADAHARRIIDHDGGDIALRLALFLDQRGIDQDDDERGQGQEPPQDAARAPRRAERERNDRERGEGGHGPPRQERREGEREAAHCPSLSRIAGTCTWSLL